MAIKHCFLTVLLFWFKPLAMSCLLLFIIPKAYSQHGCTDPLANNYDIHAVSNDGSCTYDPASISPANSTQLDATLKETSGLIFWNNEIWTHLDGGNPSALYNLGLSDFTSFTTQNITGITNVDWEDISQDDTYVYIGDFGNNANGNRTDLKIYRITKTSIVQGTPAVDVINFSYEDQTDFSSQGGNHTDFDCEAFIVTDSNIYLFTKEWISEETTVYSLPKTPGTYSAVNEGSYNVNGLITGATYLRNEQFIALSGYSSGLNPFLYVLYDFTGNDFFSGNKRKIGLNLLFHQIEGVTTNDGIHFYLSNEFIGNIITVQPQVHTYDLSPVLGYTTSGNSTHFSNPNAWIGGVVPPNGSDLVIKNDLILDINFDAATVQIENPSSLTTQPNQSLTVQNTLRVDDDAQLLLEPTALLQVNGNISNRGSIYFKSDDSGTAQFDQFTGTLAGTGEVTVERFIPAGLPTERRAYRLLTSAVNSTEPIQANWQEGVNNTGTNFPADNKNPKPGFGTHISGSTIGDNGFDATPSGNPSMFTFDNTFLADQTGETQNDAWTALPNTHTKPLKAGESYLTFVRGDRGINVTSNSATPTNTSLRATGELHTGSRTFSSSNNGLTPEYGLNEKAHFFNLAGNPYQAIVNILNLDFTNINSSTYWVWDPNLGTRGNYAVVDLTSTPVVNNTSSPANQYIQPGQSFFVQTSADGPASLTFNEDDNDISGGATAVFSEVPSCPFIKMMLYTGPAYNFGARESDGLLIKFNENASNTIDAFDADKLQGPDENLARIQDNQRLSIEQRALPSSPETLALSITGYTTDSYTFVVSTENIQANFEAFLMDNYTGTLTQLTETENTISFNVDANIPESKAEDRFSLVLDNSSLGTAESPFGKNFSLYPNPTHGYCSIKTPNLSGEVNVEITNVLGQQVFVQNLSVEAGQVNINTDEFSAGVYVLKLTQDNQSFSFKLIVE